ncbi:MAG TPA: hypothetical protein VGH11_03110 [Jatrophihabitans sp.]|jgi:hypothetical protein
MAAISRRTLISRGLLIAAAAAGAALGMTKSVHHKVAVPPPAPPRALVSLLTAQQGLLTGYDAAIASNPANSALLTALKSDVTAHRGAVQAVLEGYPGWRLAQSQPSATPPDTPVAGSTSALAAATKKLAASTASSCSAWPSADSNAVRVVPLLGSISACLNTHVGVLT